MRRTEMQMRQIQKLYALIPFLLWPGLADAAGRLNILSYALTGISVDVHGNEDASAALSAAVSDSNDLGSKGEASCVYIPAGTYRITRPPPPFLGAGCVVGDGASQSILKIDPEFSGDLFSWSEAWLPTKPGPSVSGLRIEGTRQAANIQNAFVFYDRNDEISLDSVEVNNLHGRALYSGIKKNALHAYIRESHFRSLRFFQDGAPGIPVVEFSSEGSGDIPATNEISISQMDIYGAAGPSLVIHNNGTGVLRSLIFESLRIEGLETGNSPGDLLQIGDRFSRGKVSNIRLTDVELIDPQKETCALRLAAPPGVPAPYQVTFQGFIGGGVPYGNGLCIDAGRTSTFKLSGMYTLGTNVIVGPGVSDITIDGAGKETQWSYSIDPTSKNGIKHPLFETLRP